MQLLLSFFGERNLVEVVSEGRKHPDAKQGIPTQIRARQGLIDYLDQDDASPFDFRSVYPQLVLKAGKEDSKRHLTIPDTDEAQQLASGVDQIKCLVSIGPISRSRRGRATARPDRRAARPPTPDEPGARTGGGAGAAVSADD